VGWPYVLECGSLEFRTEVDEVYICSNHLNKSEYDPDRPRNYTVSGRKTIDLENQTCKLSPFQFSRLETGRTTRPSILVHAAADFSRSDRRRLQISPA
jgi:hypothetical protein